MHLLWGSGTRCMSVKRDGWKTSSRTISNRPRPRRSRCQIVTADLRCWLQAKKVCPGLALLVWGADNLKMCFIAKNFLQDQTLFTRPRPRKSRCQVVTADLRCWLQANKVWPRPGSVCVWCKQSQDVFHWETLFFTRICVLLMIEILLAYY